MGAVPEEGSPPLLVQPRLRLTVVGLGRIGLALAVEYAQRGHRVCGADIDPWVVDRVNRSSVTPLPAEAELAARLAAAVGTGRLTATTDSSVVYSAERVLTGPAA